jgi:hypothetical protein
VLCEGKGNKEHEIRIGVIADMDGPFDPVILEAAVKPEQPDTYLFGNTQQPKVEWFGKTLLFNQGSAGPRRFKFASRIGNSSYPK